MNVFLIWKNTTEMCQFFPSLRSFCVLRSYFIGIYVERLFYCFKSCETTEQRLDVQQSVLVCGCTSVAFCLISSTGCKFSFFIPHPVHIPFTIAGGTEHLQFCICRVCFKLNTEKQINVIEPPKTLSEVTSLISDETNRLTLRVITALV